MLAYSGIWVEYVLDMINKAGRVRALELVRNDFSVDVGARDLQPPTDPAELQALLIELKAKRYALFAKLIDEILAKVETIRAGQPAGGFPASPYRTRASSGFGKLRLDALKVFIESAETLEESADYKLMEGLAEAHGVLDKDFGYINPMGQLAAGSDTAITTSLGLLKSLPGIINYHAPNQSLTGDSLKNIAQESVGLPWNIAMISIDQMMALQATAAGQLLHRGWAELDMNLDPAYFTVNLDGTGQVRAVKFDMPEQMIIPAQYQYMKEDQPLEHPTALKDIGRASPGTIGCPITLLPQRMHKLWNWLIEDIDRSSLWNA